MVVAADHGRLGRGDDGHGGVEPEPPHDDGLAAAQYGRSYIDSSFADYYSNHQAQYFAFQVWTNNFRLALLAIAFGVFFLPVVYVLYENVVAIGEVAALMIGNGKADVFFGLILPHGMLEVTCLFVSCGIGLKLFWTWVAPGHRTRTRALAEEGAPRSRWASGSSACSYSPG